MFTLITNCLLDKMQGTSHRIIMLKIIIISIYVGIPIRLYVSFILFIAINYVRAALLLIKLTTAVLTITIDPVPTSIHVLWAFCMCRLHDSSYSRWSACHRSTCAIIIRLWDCTCVVILRHHVTSIPPLLFIVSAKFT